MSKGKARYYQDDDLRQVATAKYGTQGLQRKMEVCMYLFVRKICVASKLTRMIMIYSQARAARENKKAEKVAAAARARAKLMMTPQQQGQEDDNDSGKYGDRLMCLMNIKSTKDYGCVYILKVSPMYVSSPVIYILYIYYIYTPQLLI